MAIIVSSSDSAWKFNLPHKVETESTVFNKTFKTSSTNQLQARLHLKTNVMQDMIDLNESLAKKNIVLYFNDDQMYIIFETSKNPFDPDYAQPINNENSFEEVIKDITQSLKIFDDFCLDRK